MTCSKIFKTCEFAHVELNEDPWGNPLHTLVTRVVVNFSLENKFDRLNLARVQTVYSSGLVSLRITGGAISSLTEATEGAVVTRSYEIIGGHKTLKEVLT